MKNSDLNHICGSILHVEELFNPQRWKVYSLIKLGMYI